MDVQIKIDPSATTPYLEIHTAAVTPEISALISRIAEEPSSVMLPGFRGEEVIPLYPPPARPHLYRGFQGDGRYGFGNGFAQVPFVRAGRTADRPIVSAHLKLGAHQF